ncbi:MAG: UDP-N-acetylmuramoyl-L-alanyl-D-glutamate--2,6-diaminopimelate ligase [Lachnospiraceae bacterium]|nr:UDP-N-acetylmuramoyl-L-alanyl-D-glutamate--2,6-diaminopimelate ligase [Lachnospiraceae bacterium]
MKLVKLLEKLDYKVIKGNVETEIEHLIRDSRKVGTGDIFVCIKGANSNGHDFVLDVIEKGAKAVVIQEDLKTEVMEQVPEGICLVQVENSRKALAFLSAAYFDYPAEKLITIGVTGTKGKTTTTYMIQSVLERTGVKTGLIGTIETVIGDTRIPACNTTPESYVVQESFAKMVEEGCKAVVMEVSSQGLMLDRVAGFEFDYGIFTNLSQDHIGPNEHKDFEDYMHWKSVLFEHCKTGIFNVDDAHAKDMMRNAKCKIETFGMEQEADLKASNIQLFQKPGILGISYDLSGKVTMPVEIDIPGKFSVYNSLTAISVCLHFTDDIELIEKVLSEIRVKGRVEMIDVSPDFTVMIDYAHNAMSLESLLKSLREYQPKRIVTLFGCGGNRDRNRRFEMGEVSSKLSDFTIITSDNPRFEEPEAIIEDILTGVKKADGKYIQIPDRKEAIKYAIEHGQKGDVIVLAGKGHEDYQEIKGVKHKMDERVLISEIKAELNL